MTINNAALAHGHGYDATRTNAPCTRCSEQSGLLVLTCKFDDESEDD